VRAPGEQQRERCDAEVRERGDTDRDVRVVHSKQVEPREQAAEDRADGVRRVAIAEPCHAVSLRADPLRDRGQRCTHQNRRRQQRDRRDHDAQRETHAAGSGHARVYAAEGRNRVQANDAERAHDQLQHRVTPERRSVRRESAIQPRAKSQAAEERREKHAERDGRGADHERQLL
jgi:hypothetical protein